MKLRYLFLRELQFRPIGFVLAVLAVAAAAACPVGVWGFLAAHDRETDALVAELESRASARMARLRDDARVFSKSLGFNILVLPQAQDAGLLFTENRSRHYLLPDQVAALGGAKLAYLNHLLPMLRHRVAWDAYGGDVVLVGVEGEIYIKAPKFQKPIKERLEAGGLRVGHAIAQRRQLEEGASVTLLGEEFSVRGVLPQKGNIDDASILMNLGDVQRLTGLAGKVSGLLALSCNCAAGDKAPIEKELREIVPGLQVVEFTVRAKARQQAREAIGAGTREEMDDIRTSRAALRDELAAFAGILVTLAATVAAVVLVVLSVMNVRERRTEGAMLRALGLGTGRLLALFLGKTLLSGLCGGVLGVCAGVWIGEAVFGTGRSVSLLFGAGVVAAATVLAVLATVAPAVHAARSDPAMILNQE